MRWHLVVMTVSLLQSRAAEGPEGPEGRVDGLSVSSLVKVSLQGDNSEWSSSCSYLGGITQPGAWHGLVGLTPGREGAHGARTRRRWQCPGPGGLERATRCSDIAEYPRGQRPCLTRGGNRHKSLLPNFTEAGP